MSFRVLAVSREVAGFELAEARMQKSTSVMFMRSEQVGRSVRQSLGLTASDHNLVSFLCSCVFFVSRGCSERVPKMLAHEAARRTPSSVRATVPVRISHHIWA